MAAERKAPALTVVVDDDMTHCSICTEIFDNPWSLPCLHTFCMKCLDSLRTHSHPKSNLKCPICKRECEISAEGIVGITHNFFIQRLVDSIKQPGPSNAYCSEHKNRSLEIYCFDCKRNVCMRCCTTNHKDHNYQDVDDVASAFRDQIDADIAAVQSRIDETTRHQQQQKTAVDSFLDSLNSVESAVNKRYNELKTSIDNEKKRLLKQIESTKERAVKQFEEAEERENLSLVAMKSFIIYAQELKSQEQSRDVTRDGDGIHDRASELLMTYPMGEVDNGPRLVFKPAYNHAELKNRRWESNLMGQLSETTNSHGGSKRTPADNTITVTARPKRSLDVGKSGTANGSAVIANRERSGSIHGATRRSVGIIEVLSKPAVTVRQFPPLPSPPISMDLYDVMSCTSSSRSTPSPTIYFVGHNEIVGYRQTDRQTYDFGIRPGR